MKIQTVLISAALIFVFVLGCDKKADDASDSSIQQQKQLPEALDKIDETYQNQVKQQEADNAKMMAQYTERGQKAEALINAQEEAHKKYVDLMARNEALLKQQEDLAARWEKIRTKWEKQQEQYQKYLDSIKK
jgi:hypothetical protein